MIDHYKIEIATFKFPLVQIEDFSLQAERITFLFGESGIGKTLIAQTLYGLIQPDSLRILVNGKSYFHYLHSRKLKELQRSGFFVFQEPSTHLNPLMTLEQQLNEGSLSRSTENKAILESLWAAPFEQKIKPLLRVYPKPYRPSGGEKQRFLLAMALKKMDLQSDSSGLFIFDEPTGSLDNRFRDIFLQELFKRFRQQARTILFITHDYSMISEIEKHHADLLPEINLVELRRINAHRVQLFPFKAQDYLHWLSNQKPAKTARFTGKKVVLRVKSHFSVFGRRFAFFKERGRRPCDLIVEKGKLTYLKAPSGLGKTTLAKIVSGLQKAQKIKFELGGLTFDERTPVKVWRQHVWGKKLSMVFQHADEALNLNASVLQVFQGLPLSQELSRSRLKSVLQEIFDQPVTDAFLNKKVAFLSGGQKQRLNLLRALLLHPDLIILDEPLNGLDFNSIQRILKIIEEKMVSGSGLLLISHNEEIFDRIIPRSQVFHLRIS